MRKRKLLSIILALLCFASSLFGCTPKQNSGNSDGSESSIVLPDSELDSDGGTVLPDSGNSDDSTGSADKDSDSADNGDNSDSSNQDSSDSDNSEDNDNTENEDNKIELPDDYVVTIADMERFLLTKDEQYPITNEYVELYQQASGGYIDNAKKAGLVVDKAQHLPSQNWHYFD